MEKNIKRPIQARVTGSKYYTFNFPEEGDKVILLHNPFNQYDSNAIMVINAQLQQIGHLSKLAGFNKKIGELINWQPYLAEVVAVFPDFMEIFVEINMDAINQKKENITSLRDKNYSLN